MSDTVKLMGGITPEYYKNLSLEDIHYINPEGIECVEEWRDIEGFDGHYKVSILGRIKSLAREVNAKWDYQIPDKILTQGESDYRGYVRVHLTLHNITTHKYVQILVATAFIPNPLKKRTVNHKKGNKKDNRVWMLEWNTHGENHKHSYRELGRKHSMLGKTGYTNKQSKEVLCITNGKKYGSVTDAANELGLFFQNVSKVCKNKRKHTKGFIFKFT